MSFAGDPEPFWGFVVTTIFTIALGFVIWVTGGSGLSTVLRMETDQSASSFLYCLATDDGERLLGKLSKVGIFNPNPRRWGSRASTDYTSAGGHVILVYDEHRRTRITVRARGPLSREQAVFLEGCAENSARW